METKPSRFNYLWKYIGAMFFVFIAFLFGVDYFTLRAFSIFSLALFLNQDLIFWLAISSMLVAILLVIKAEIDRYKTRYKISEHRVFKIVGILKRSTISIPFQKLERTDVIQSFIGRLLDLGTVRVDTGEEHFFLEGVKNPEEIDKLIFEEGIKKQRQ